MNAQSKSLSDALVFPDEQTIQHYLSQSKTTISYSEEDKIDILDAAVSYGTCEQLEYLLNNHSFSQDLISTAACWACAVSVEKVKLIVEHAPQAAEDLKTGLLNAINWNHSEIIDYLSEIGCKADLSDIYFAFDVIHDNNSNLSDADEYYEMIKAVISSAKSNGIDMNDFYLDKSTYNLRPYCRTCSGPNVDVYEPYEEFDKPTSAKIFKLLLQSGAGLENPAKFFFSSDDFNTFREQFKNENPNSTKGYNYNWVDDCREGFREIRNDPEINAILKQRFPEDYKVPTESFPIKKMLKTQWSFVIQ